MKAEYSKEYLKWEQDLIDGWTHEFGHKKTPENQEDWYVFDYIAKVKKRNKKNTQPDTVLIGVVAWFVITIFYMGAVNLGGF